DGVVVAGAVDDYFVGDAITAAAGGGQVDPQLREVGAGQGGHRDGVRPAQGAQVEGLHAVEVHGHRAHVAGQAHVAGGGGQVEGLAHVGAVEGHRVGAVAAGDHVA